MIRFSVIVPVYNASSTICRCVKSIYANEYNNLETIIVDDGSTDDSLYKCYWLQKKYKSIKIFHKENGGVSSARNFGITNSNGDYILFLDADDTITDNCLLTLDQALQKEVDLLIFGHNRCNGEEISTKNSFECGEWKKVDDIANCLISKDNYFRNIWGKAYRSNVIKNNNVFLMRN